MQLIIDPEEAWSLMTLVTGYIIDKSGISSDGKQAVRSWRTDRSIGTVEMDEVAVGLNRAIGTYLDEKSNRQIRARGHYRRKADQR